MKNPVNPFFARGEPSPALARRADAAILLYREKKVQHILVTGDSVTHDEVTPVRNYLIAKGIPESDIFLDTLGLDTYSSMYRARSVFGADSIIIVTQDFHLPRALFIARLLGIESHGVIAEGATSDLGSYVREIPASLKAIVDLLMRREPLDTNSPIQLATSTPGKI